MMGVPGYFFVVRRARHPGRTREVYHRASGLHLGCVAQHPPHYGGNTGLWSAWLPERLGAAGDAVGLRAATMHEACVALVTPRYVVPPIDQRVCRRCSGSFRSGQRVDCADCENYADALARSRVTDPRWWAHYDAVVALGVK